MPRYRTGRLPSFSSPRHALTLLVLILLAGCQLQPPEPADADKLAIDRMLALIDERLDVAEDVARAKWNSGAAINAPERGFVGTITRAKDGRVVRANRALATLVGGVLPRLIGEPLATPLRSRGASRPAGRRRCWPRWCRRTARFPG